jgi:tetratricopeptide (TPR) repeat protein
VFHPEVGYAGKDHSSFAAITDRLSLNRLSAFGGCDPNLVATSVPFVHELGSQDNPYVSMALWAEAHDNPSEALSYFKKAISYQPGLGMAEIRLGEFFMRQGDCASALAIFNKLLSIQPDNTYVLNKRGEAYELLGDPVAGRKSFSRVLEVDPDNQFAKLKLGLLPQPKKP